MFITLSTSEPYSFLISQLRPAAHPRTSLTLPSLCLWTSLPPPSAWILLGSVFSPWLFSLTSLEISLCPKLSTPTPMSAVQISVLSISFLYPATCWTLPFQCSFIFSISKQVSSDLMFCWIWNGDCDERKNPFTARCYPILIRLLSLCSSVSFTGLHSYIYILKVSTHPHGVFFRKIVSYYLQPHVFLWALVPWYLSNTTDPSHRFSSPSNSSAHSIFVIATSLVLDTQAWTHIFPLPTCFTCPTKAKA